MALTLPLLCASHLRYSTALQCFYFCPTSSSQKHSPSQVSTPPHLFQPPGVSIELSFCLWRFSYLCLAVVCALAKSLERLRP
jgi:hypothetical protein